MDALSQHAQSCSTQNENALYKQTIQKTTPDFSLYVGWRVD
jgi:hypothetical protein